ncbi:MAG: hypothetical protein KAS16_00180 [Thermoplasmata archaeon]|nr:hypothetical protein [Thermoplasmata archaeon]
MEIMIAIIIGLILTLVLGAILAMRHRKDQGMEKETDYKALYTLGISMIGLGIVFTAAINTFFIGFLIIGVIYMVVGLKNKDKWVDKA